MTRSHLAIVLTLIAASCVALLLFLRSTAESPRPRTGAVASPHDPAAQAESHAPLTVPGADGARPEDDRRVLAPAPSEAEVPRATPAPALDAALVVRCVAKPGGQPLSGIRVSVSTRQPRGPGGAPDGDGTRGTLDKAPITGAEGQVEFDLPSGVELHIFAGPERDEAGYVDRDLAALAKGERRVLVLEIAAGLDLGFQGLVIARESSAPIAGARVLVLRSTGPQAREGDQGEERFEKLAEATTDQDGRFDLATSSWKNPFVRVDAEGFGPVLFAPGTGHATRETARVVKLDRSAAIEATVVDANGAPLPGVTVEVVANGHELQPKDGAWEFDSASVTHVRWSDKTGGDGRCTLEALAANVALSVVLVREGKVVQKEAQPVTLEPGETRALKWTIGSGCELRGLLVDQHAKPVPLQELWLVQARSREARYFNQYESFRLETRTDTDEAGRFTIHNVGAGPWWLGPAPDPNPSALELHDAPAPFAMLIDVPDDAREMDVVVEVQRGLYIRGRVLDSSGAAAPDTSVTAGMDGKWWGMSAQSKSDGTFAVGPLMPGKFQMIAQGRGTDSDSAPLDARAGDSEVILKLRLGGIIEGQVVDASGAGCRAGISISAQHVARFDMQLMGTQNDGTFKWEGLEPGAYDLVARLNDGRVAVARAVSLAAGAKVSGLVLTLEPGAKLRLRYTGPGAAPWFKVRSAGAVVVSDPLEKDKPSVVVVPAGKISIELRLEGDERVERRDLEIAPGDDKEIVLGEAR